MCQLVLLKRSDANLVLVACCDHMEHAVTLAAELSKMQAFNVTVLACLPTLGEFKNEIHKALAAQHIQNSWYAASPCEVLRVASGFFDASPSVRIAEAELEKVVVGWSEPKKEVVEIEADARVEGVAREAVGSPAAQTESVACPIYAAAPAATQENPQREAVASAPAYAQSIESVAHPIYAAAPNATQESPQSIETGKGLESDDKRQGSDESDESELVEGDVAAASKDSQSDENTGAMLVPCAKCDAGTARSITEALRKKLGKEAAAALLKQYKQAVMRDSEGRNTRFWVDAAGGTVKLADGVADSAAAGRWQPNLALEQAYDDLSDASSLDGNESPAHRQVKEYARCQSRGRCADN
jgi:hypothetical protein